jgi:enamine deaminase RidA (YjgF/YER057c/UK114 family)
VFISIILFTGCESDAELSNTFINPASGYSQVVTTEACDVKTIYISGQVGEGETLDAQMRDALQNLKDQLKAADATYSDIIKMNSYIVNYKPEDLTTFRNVRKEIIGDEDMPASTLVGVTALALPEWLIEIEAIAVVKSDH